MKKKLAFLLALVMLLALCAGMQPAAFAEAEEMQVTDMIGREVTVTPGSYSRVVCIGAGVWFGGWLDGKFGTPRNLPDHIHPIRRCCRIYECVQDAYERQ